MTRKSAESRFYAGTLILILLLAFALRLTALDAQSLWYDEGVTAVVAQYDPLTLIRWTADDIQPPLYYLVVSAWGQVAGWSEWSLRFVSAAFGTLLVPLLAALTYALTGRRSAALTAALITALHPLLLYYSQEARMYSMLVVLGVVAADCGLRMANGESSRRGGWLWIGYVLAATASLYTHYFAVFLLAALNLAFLSQYTIFIRNPQSVIRNPLSAIRPFLLANTAVVLLFAPWIGVLVTRLRVDTSYWAGTFKLGEALHDIAIRFTLGETVLESAATPWLWLYAAVTALALWQAAGGRWQIAVSSWRLADNDAAAPLAPRNPQSPTFILLYSSLYLLLPIVAVLALASLTPKFNPRYVMLALPGLIVLWSAGLTGIHWRFRQRPQHDPQSPIPSPQSLIPHAILIAGFLYANINWFTNPAFTKDQWRELTAYVRDQRQPDEAVVLVSGHAWPIWDYYASDIETIRLPEIEILDVDAVLDFANTVDPLRRGLEDNAAAWLVGWQDDVIDPMQVTPLQLARGGEETPIDAQFWGINLRRFAVDPSQISAEPPIAHPTAINFGNTVELLGHTVDPNGTLFLYWRQPLQSSIINRQSSIDLLLSGETVTTTNLPYADLMDQRLTGYDYPSFRWQPGQVTVGRIAALDWAGDAAMPGNYRLYLGVYDPTGDAAGVDVLAGDGTPQGKRITLDVTLPRPTISVIGENPTSWPELAPGIFADAVITQPSQLNVRWWTDQSLAGHTLVVNWQRNGQSLAEDRFDVAPGFPTVSWTDQWPMRGIYPIPSPQGLEPGDYRLAISLADGGISSLFLPITIELDERSFVVPELAVTVGAAFGGQLSLPGLVTPFPSTVTTEESLPLTLVWQASGPTNADLSVTVQWIGEDGRPVAQADAVLPSRSSTWVAGEVVTQPFLLSAPDTPGTYRLIVAVYDANATGLPRLRLNDSNDALDLGTIQVSQ
ncbi:phospholipid carrier-dependent glycosyltransferase [bacterium]|nr:phospholipid carrier-dependent glycosyltransferase [bacterium]